VISRLKRNRLFAVVLVALAIIAACAPPTVVPEEATPASQVVTIEQLHTMLDAEDFLFVNVALLQIRWHERCRQQDLSRHGIHQRF